MSDNPVLSRLGFARKAGRLSFGFAKTKEAILKGKSKLIVIASDISEKSEKETRFFAKDIPVLKIENTIEEISAAVSFRAGIVSVNDQGFAEAILKQIQGKANKEETVHAD